MATSLNAGYSNNINVIQVRVNGAHSHRYTDRAIDIDGDGDKEQVSIVVTAGHAGGTGSHKITQVITKPAGIARSLVSDTFETDGGVELDSDVSEFTTGS